MSEEPKQDVNKLMSDAVKQLADHKAWLSDEILKVNADVNMYAMRAMLAEQAKQIKLRVVRADKGIVSVVYDYPDLLFAFLNDPSTPEHLRDTLAGGQMVSVDQPAFTAVRTES